MLLLGSQATVNRDMEQQPQPQPQKRDTRYSRMQMGR
jgi:hypothetical protein